MSVSTCALQCPIISKKDQESPFSGMVGTAEDGMVIEYEEISSSTTTTKGGEGAVPEGGFKHPHTKHHGESQKKSEPMTGTTR